MFKKLAEFLGDRILRYLDKPTGKYQPATVSDPALLSRCLKPGDVLLIEGNSRIASIVKYLTQSTWSHAALYVGDALAGKCPGVQEPPVLIEALAKEGVIAVPLSKYAHCNTRICRAVGLGAADLQKVIGFAVASLGKQYDVKNIVDLARYLLPHPPVPVSARRRMLALGSGDPTRAICSTLIAQAFQSVPYPILPEVRVERVQTGKASYVEREILHIRHHALFVPRDFDISPYFDVINPTIECGFDFRTLDWETH